MISAEFIFLACAVVLFIYAAVSDFTTWRIPNWTVLALVAIYGAGTAARWMLTPASALGLLEATSVLPGIFDNRTLSYDLAAACLLLVIGIVFWSLRLFGAGDAKLFFPIGLFIGWIGLLPFAMLLALAGVVTGVALRMPLPLPLQFSYFFVRLDEIRRTKKVPYGVLMVIAALATMALRLGQGI